MTVQPSAVAVQPAARTLAAHQLALLQEAWIEEVEEDDRCCWSRIYYSAAAEHRFRRRLRLEEGELLLNQLGLPANRPCACRHRGLATRPRVTRRGLQ